MGARPATAAEAASEPAIRGHSGRPMLDRRRRDPGDMAPIDAVSPCATVLAVQTVGQVHAIATITPANLAHDMRRLGCTAGRAASS